MNIKTHKLGSSELAKVQELWQLYVEVFEEKNFTLPSDEYLQSLLEKDNVIFFVYQVDDQILGGLTAYELPSIYGDYSELYIYDLAVKTQFQRQGIGTRLIKELKEYCRDTKIREIFVQADTVDDYALKFYRKTGGQEEDVRHFNFPLKL